MARGDPRPRRIRRNGATIAGWLLAAGVYIGIGLYEVDFLLSFWAAVAYVLLVAWLVPAGVRKVVGRLRPRRLRTRGTETA